MFDTIRKNKIQSLTIVFVFIVAITLILYYVFWALDLGSMAIIISLILL